MWEIRGLANRKGQRYNIDLRPASGGLISRLKMVRDVMKGRNFTVKESKKTSRRVGKCH